MQGVGPGTHFVSGPMLHNAEKGEVNAFDQSLRRDLDDELTIGACSTKKYIGEPLANPLASDHDRVDKGFV